jgi:lysozyme
MTTVPKAARELVARFEGCKLKAYKCPAGVWTCGYGATGSDVGPGTVWTQDQAAARLDLDLSKFATAVTRIVRVPVTEGQRAALISFAFNLGSRSLQESTLMRLLNDKQYEAAADQFPRWNKAGGKVLAGLTTRRAAERELFLQGA